MKHIRELMPQTEAELLAMMQSEFEKRKNFAACESPIEEDFLRCYYNVKSECVSINGQTNCQTKRGTFWLDFVLNDGQRKIGIECDGKQFHNETRDKLRDDSILETGLVDVIYRVPGKSLWFHTYEALDLLRMREPQLFSEKGSGRLKRFLNDGTERGDIWYNNAIERTLARRECFDDEYDDTENRKEPRMKSVGSVFLTWASRS